MDAKANATTRNGRNRTAWTPSNVFLNRVPRFESWRGRNYVQVRRPAVLGLGRPAHVPQTSAALAAKSDPPRIGVPSPVGSRARFWAKVKQ